MDSVNLVPEGFPVYGLSTLCYVSEDGQTLHMNVPAYKIMVTAETDLANLPDDLPPGTEAFLADESAKWRKASNGTWAEIVAAAEEDNQPADSEP